MKHIVKLISALILLSCNSSKNLVSTEKIPIRVDYYSGTIKSKAEVAVFDSIAGVDSIEYGYYKNGNIKYAMPWSKGKLDGNAYSFHKNGSIKSVTQYYDNRIRSSTFYYKGTPNQSIDTFGLLRLYGAVQIEALRFYDSTGTKKTFEHYYSKNFILRTLKKYENGELDSIFYYNKKGKLNGVAW